MTQALTIRPFACRIAGRDYRVRELAAADRPEVERLFHTAFGQQPHPQWHDWKYRMGQAIGLWDQQGRLLAHYAGFPRLLYWQGRPLPAIQIGDVMVDPSVRGLLTRKGPFYQVCQAFFSSRLGAEPAYGLAFGFSNDRAVRLGQVLDLYYNPGPIQQLAWPLGSVAKETNGWPFQKLQALEATPQIRQGLSSLWPLMRNDFAGEVMGVRDWTYVESRFIRRPDQDYLYLAYRHWPWGRVQGLLILARRDSGLELLDFIGPKHILPKALNCLKPWAASRAFQQLRAWASPRVAELLMPTQPQILGTAAHLAIAKASLPAADAIQDANWWWMGGDTDFL